MERRAFLALIASAPIAALAPWPHFLNPPKLMMRADAFAQMFDAFESPVRIDIIEGVGYFRRSVDDNGKLVIDRFPN